MRKFNLKIIVFLIFITLMASFVTAVIRGENWEKSCSNETCSIIYHSGQVNYYNGSEYLPINKTIEPKSLTISGRDYSLGVDNGTYKAYFRSQSSDVKNRPVAMVKDNYVLTFSPQDKIKLLPKKATKSGDVGDRIQSNAVIFENKVTYPNQYKEIGSSDSFANLTYEYQNMQIKENLVIWDKDYLQSRFDSQNKPEDYEIVNLVFTNIIRAYKGIDSDSQTLGIFYGNDRIKFKEFGLSANDEITTTERIDFTDKNNNIVYYIPKLYAKDSNNSRILLNKTLSMSSFGNLKIDILTPFTWLNDSNRVYPIYIDPTITLTGTTHNLADVHYRKQTPVPHYMAPQMKWNITDIPVGANINNASLCLWIDDGTSPPNNDDYNVSYIADETWDETISVATHNAQIKRVEETGTLTSTDDDTWACMNVTHQLQASVDNLDENFTVRFQDPDNGNLAVTGTGYIIEDEVGLWFGQYGAGTAILMFEDRENTFGTGNLPYLVVNYTVPDIIPPIISTYFNLTVEYGVNDTLAYDLNATDASDVTWWVNDTVRFKINFSGFIQNTSVGLNLGTYNINITVNDTENNKAGFIFKYIVEDTLVPVITLVSPINLTSQESNIFDFDYLAIDFHNISNCTLYINGVNNTFNNNVNNFSVTLADGTYNWEVFCYDESGNLGKSKNFTFTNSAIGEEAPSVGTASGSGGAFIEDELSEEELALLELSLLERIFSTYKNPNNGMCDEGEYPFIDEDCEITLDKIKTGEMFKEMWVLRLLLFIIVIMLFMKSQYLSFAVITFTVLLIYNGLFKIPNEVVCTGFDFLKNFGFCFNSTYPLVGWTIGVVMLYMILRIKV